MVCMARHQRAVVGSNDDCWLDDDFNVGWILWFVKHLTLLAVAVLRHHAFQSWELACLQPVVLNSMLRRMWIFISVLFAVLRHNGVSTGSFRRSDCFFYVSQLNCRVLQLNVKW